MAILPVVANTSVIALARQAVEVQGSVVNAGPVETHPIMTTGGTIINVTYVRYPMGYHGSMIACAPANEIVTPQIGGQDNGVIWKFGEGSNIYTL